MKLYQTSVKKPIGTSLIFIGMVIIGLMFYRQLPVDLYPNIDLNMISVMTTYPGAGSDDVEANVTRLLEDVLNSTENLKEISSQSKDGLSMITLQFNYGSDIDNIMLDVRDKVDMVKRFLPTGTENPIILKFSSDMIPVVILSATAEQSSDALYKILDDYVANPLNRIPGVGTVSVGGAPKREIQVNVIPQRLEAYSLPLEQVAQVIAQENVNVPAGNFDIGSQTYLLRLEGEFKDSKDLQHIIVANRRGKAIRLSDVATVKDTLQTRVQENYTNGKRSASIVVQKQSGANTVEIAQAVKAAIPQLQKTLPPDITLVTVNDTSEHIENSINSLLETVLLALLFVGAVVLFFLGRWRATIIIMVTIPISLIGSFIYLHLTGNTINIISLSALSITIGMVVDDAIVVLENITSHIERGSHPIQAAVYGTEEVSLSIIASTLTIVAVFLPMTMVGGFSGILFRQLGWMVTIIISLSLLISMTLTPMMSSRMMKSVKKTKDNLFDKWYKRTILPTLDSIDRGYSQLVNTIVKRRWWVVMCITVIFIVSVFVVVKNLKTEFMPTSDNNLISLKMELPTGTRTEITRETGDEIAHMLREKYPSIKILSYSVGQADDDNIWAAMQDNGSNILTYNIRLVQQEERTQSIFDLSEQMRKDIAQIPAVDKFVVTPGGNNGPSTGGGNLMSLEIYGYDLLQTNQLATTLRQKLAHVEGLKDITISRKDFRQEYQVEFDRDKLALNNLNMTTVSNAIRNRINGLTLSRYREDGEEYNIRVRYDEQYRHSLQDIQNILIYNPMGNAIRLRDVGKVVEKSSLPQIDRKDRQRIVTVNGTIYKRALSDIIEDVSTIIDSTTIPAGLDVQIAGSYKDQQESFGDLITLLLLVTLLVYIVLAYQFESLIYPFMIILTVPFAFIGALFLLSLLGEPLGIMGLVGLIMLVGMVSKNGIVLIDYINLNRERGMSIRSAVIHGGESRLRPVLMTTFTTILGMLPLAMGTGQGAEMWKSLGIAIIGGMTFSTIITLILLPSIYSIIANIGLSIERYKLKNRPSTYSKLLKK